MAENQERWQRRLDMRKQKAGLMYLCLMLSLDLCFSSDGIYDQNSTDSAEVEYQLP